MKAKIKITLYVVGIIINFIPIIITFFAMFEGISEYLFASYFYIFFLSFLFYCPYFFLAAKKNQYIKRFLILFFPCLFYAVLTILYCYLLEKYNYNYHIEFSMFVPAILLNLAYNFVVKIIIDKNIEPYSANNEVKNEKKGTNN